MRAVKDMESVEIVRCKDCRYWNYVDTTEFAHWCSNGKGLVDALADDYCSYGKRKEKIQLSSETSTNDLISRQAAIELACWRCKKCERKDCEYKDSCETMSLLEALPSEDPKPPVEPKPVCEDAISRQDLSDKVGRYYAERGDFGSFECSWILGAIKNAPSVEPKRPKGEWVSCSEPPEDRRNVFIAHGTNDFKSCCIGHYEQGMGWYEDRNFFAKPIYDCKYWCDIPELPNLGDNQFGTGVSADMRGDKE